MDSTHVSTNSASAAVLRPNEFFEWKFLNLSQNRKLADELRYETCFYIQSILRIVFCSKLLITNSTINGTAAQQIGNGHFSSLQGIFPLATLWDKKRH